MKKKSFPFVVALFTACIGAAFLIAAPVSAQQVRLDDTALDLKAPLIDSPSAKAVTDNATPKVRHLTLELMESQEGQDAVELYHKLRAAGKIPFAGKGARSPVGTIRTFIVRNALSDDPPSFDVEFEKKAEGPLVNIWVSTDELANGHVLDSEIERMLQFAGESTDAGSFDPGKGIIENNNSVFGAPPDVDGDGILDVLLLDIQDDYETTGIALLGFFDPLNLTGQNLADIIYLDTFPTLVDENGVRGKFDEPSHTLAHEYEQGLAEWGEIINGFTARSTRYFQQESERVQPLLGWRGVENSLVLNDYQRAGLFTNYLADRIGILPTGSIARAISPGADKYIDVLIHNGLLLSDVVLDFHTANLLNDRSIDPVFGYTVPQYAEVKVSAIREIDGSAATSAPPSFGTLPPGAVFYTRWNNVANLELTFSDAGPILSGRVVLKKSTGETTIETVDVAAGGEGNFFSGNFESVTLILTNINFGFPEATPFEFSSRWNASEPEFLTEEIIYDTGTLGSLTIEDQDFFSFQLDPEFITANRFEVPAFAQLGSVKIDHVYLSEFSNSGVPSGSLRNFTLHIWAENAQGLPGDELLTIELDDVTSPGFFVNFDFQTISLENYAGELANLPGVIFVGVSNAGTDDNDIVMTISDFPVGLSPSYMFFPGEFGGWARFNQITVVGASFAQSVLPIRATFIFPAEPVAVDDPFELPDAITLHQNYPNPFNPSTTIEYSLPEAGNVRLVVYDMLGREVATVVDDFRTVGIHQVNFNASNLASGLYLYSLVTDAIKVTRTMTLLR